MAVSVGFFTLLAFFEKVNLLPVKKDQHEQTCLTPPAAASIADIL
jgi:hypothetical protein